MTVRPREALYDQTRLYTALYQALEMGLPPSYEDDLGKLRLEAHRAIDAVFDSINESIKRGKFGEPDNRSHLLR